MTEKIIDEVMGLVTRLEGAIEFGTHEQIQWEKEAIRAKLREVLERKPLTDEQIMELFEKHYSHDQPQGQYFDEIVRHAERAHGIGS